MTKLSSVATATKTLHGRLARTARCSAAVLITASLLSGCGQKGALVLPEPTPAAAQPAASAAPARSQTK